MASQITHIVFGKKIFDRIPNNKLSWPEFVVGTSFPDIRYPAKISRELTHFRNTSEEKIPLDNSFKAGMYVHSIVDENFAILMQDTVFIDWLSRDIYYDPAFKYALDKILYAQYSDWSSIVKYFDIVYSEEKEIVKDQLIIEKWHKVTQSYFLKGPTDEVVQSLVSVINIDEQLAKKVMNCTKEIVNNQEILEKLMRIEDII